MIWRAVIGVAVLAMTVAPTHLNAQEAAVAAAGEPSPRFEVAAIKPSKPGDDGHNWYDLRGRLAIENFTLREIIEVAYDLKTESQVVGGPKWIGTEHFDIVAKADDAETAEMRKMSRKQWVGARTLMLQSLLADRYNLKVSRGVRRLPVYALVIARFGIKFKASPADERGYELSVRNGQMTATAVSMDHLADYLSRQSEIGDRVVINRTSLAGQYDFKMNWTSDRGEGIPPDAKYPGLFTALKEQLGLELKPEKASVEVIIVNSASEPAID